jgi:hypothetical protein
MKQSDRQKRIQRLRVAIEAEGWTNVDQSLIKFVVDTVAVIKTLSQIIEAEEEGKR